MRAIGVEKGKQKLARQYLKERTRTSIGSQYNILAQAMVVAASTRSGPRVTLKSKNAQHSQRFVPCRVVAAWHVCLGLRLGK